MAQAELVGQLACCACEIVPVSLLFDNPVDTSHRAAVEKKLKVTTAPRVEGSWGWLKDHSGKDRIDWRPKDPWLAGTKVSVKGRARRPRRRERGLVRPRLRLFLHRRLRPPGRRRHALAPPDPVRR
ncbi:hypothetical protein GCM10010388_63630 [Streptomyces mauvecolor]